MRWKYSLKPASKDLLTGGLLIFTMMALGFSTHVLAHGAHSKQKTAIQAEFVVLQVTRQGPQIKRIDTQGHTQVLYTVPKGDRLYQFQHAPDKPQLLLSYQQKQTGLQGIWTLDYTPGLQPESKETSEASAAQNSLAQVLVDNDPNTFFFDPLFANKTDRKADGIYYVSAQIDEKTGRASKNLALRFYNLNNKKQQLVARDASHPSVSKTGKFLTWTEQKDTLREVKVLQTDTQNLQIYQVTNPKTVVRFSRVNDPLNTLFFFSNKETLLAANSILSSFSLSNVTLPNPLLPAAHAHSGHKHADSFGWQISLDNKDLAQSRHTWEVSDIRAFDVSHDGKQAAWLNSDGLHIVDITTGKPLKTIKNPNYWKLVYIN